jgi:hypothetical protein
MENKTGKYLKYAIGEIVLVVIGILIALQINTWNEQRKQKNLEMDYYCQLLEDVKQDLIQIHSQIDKSNERLEASNTLLQLLQTDNPKYEDVMPLAMKSLSLVTYTLRPNLTAFEDLKSSGNLNILKDNTIKIKITDYYSMIDGMIDVMDINADGVVNLFYAQNDFADIGWQYMDFVKNGIDTTKIDLNKLNPNKQLTNESKKRLTSDAVFFIGANSRIKYLYETILPDIENMIELLNNKCQK